MEENVERDAKIKEIEKRALEAARLYESAKTGYVHHSSREGGEGRETIPVYENVLFVLALLRSKTAQQIQEAKKKLRALLYFQNRHEGEEMGNFPVYLHEYPFCQDPSLALQLLAPFYWILKEFGSVLGHELKEELEKSVYLALHFALQHQERICAFPYAFLVRLAAAWHQFGELFQERDWICDALKMLQALAEEQLVKGLQTKQLADLLIALQMLYSDISISPWAMIWEQMKKTWHPQLASYVGPCIKEVQEGMEPKVGLYDLFQGFFTGKKSKRAALLSIYDLHAILIRPSLALSADDSWGAEIAVEKAEKKWTIFSSENSACTLLEKKEPIAAAQEKFYTPYRLVFGGSEALHSLVCQGGNIETFSYRGQEDELCLLFDLKEGQAGEGSAVKREIEFFVDALAEPSFTVEGEVATTFLLGEQIAMSSPYADFTLLVTFSLHEGEGDFIGHLMLGNRPSQVSSKAVKEFVAYDWTFFLRSLRRSARCTLAARLKKVKIR